MYTQNGSSYITSVDDLLFIFTFFAFSSIRWMILSLLKAMLGRRPTLKQQS